jgi:hypothetical protein
MNAQDAIVPFTALLMLGLIWVRTRIQYSGKGVGRLRLERAGQLYFAAAAGLLALGWFAAPALAQTFWPAPGATPTLVRVVWCLATYYVFIIVHRILKARGTALFRHQEPAITPR